MKRISILTLILLTCFVSAAWPQAQGNHKPKIITFDAPGAGTGANQGTFAWFINSARTIAGWYIDSNNVWHGFVRDPATGNIQTIDYPGASNTSFNAINDSHPPVLTGDYSDSNIVFHGVLYSDGNFTPEFDCTQAGTGAWEGTAPQATNAAGLTTGFCIDSNFAYHGFVRDAGGTITDFDCPQAGTNSYQGTLPNAWSLNSAGTIVAQCFDNSNVMHGSVRNPDGTIKDFDVKGAGTGAAQGTNALGINSNGWITGYYVDAKGVSHGYLRDPKGKITKFDVRGAGKQSGQGTFAWCINSVGAVAGVYYDSKTVGHGYVRAPGGAVTTYEFPGAGSGYGNWVGTTAINDKGQVAGTYTDANMAYHSFLWIP